VWFTLSRGIVTEIFSPTADLAAIHDFCFVVTDSRGFFSEEQRDCAVDTRTTEPGIPFYTVENSCLSGRYQIFKHILVDPSRDVLLQQVKLVPSGVNLDELRLFVLLTPHLGDRGKGNSGRMESYRNTPMLMAQREQYALALASSAPWISRTVSYVGPQDAWHQLHTHGQIIREFDRAYNGNISLAGEIDLKRCQGQFLLALSFDESGEGAALNALLSLNEGFGAARDQYVASWQSWHKQLSDFDGANFAQGRNKDHLKRPDHSRPRVHQTDSIVEQNLYRTSLMVLRTHRAKKFSGAGVASLSTPWGEARGDEAMEYHLVWSRDLVEEAAGLLAAGAGNEALDTLNYLRATQKSQGGWPKNMRVDGQAHSDGIQLDEAALPVLLANLLHRYGVLDDAQMEKYWPMVRDAAAFIIRSGPETGQDRWENTSGLSPYTLATEIAALLIAAGLSHRFGDAKTGDLFRQSADLWNDLIEPWTYVIDTPLSRRIGVEGYYVRIAPSPGMHTLKRRGEVPHMKQAHDLPVREVVSPDALALVRFGLRAPDDPRILNTIKAIDAMTRVDLPAGPCWRRYNGDYYGEYDDGTPFGGADDKNGIGRPWPLLTGERGHYALAAGNLDRAKQLLEAMGGFSSQVGFLPEQVWDRDDLPDRALFRGRPSGSAMPLAWAHAEYIRLLRSIRDGQLFDQPPDTRERYVQNQAKSNLCLWRFDHQCDSIFAGRKLRIELMAPAVVHFSTNDWHSANDIETQDTGLGFHLVDLPVQQLKAGSKLRFTFRWPEAENRWEGKDFELEVEPALESERKAVATTQAGGSRRLAPAGSQG
jgi:glucoamylase